MWGIPFRKIYWTLAALGGIWAVFLSALTHPTIQRHALYAHKLHSAWWQNVDEPEQWGYLKNQITPFNITTPDEELLYAWHVLPLGVYHKHEKELIAEHKLADIASTKGFEILKSNPDSKLVISFHGNAGHVGQGWRTDGYRALSSGSPDSIHVLAFDYRGYGRSTGSPTEAGLITDGIAAVTWALEVAQIPPHRIAIVGQSLGTAVATATVEHFSTRGVDFSGLALIAPFSDLRTLLLTYTIGGFVPILQPLNAYPAVQRYVESTIVDTWHTLDRLTAFVRSSKSVNLIIIHALNDFDIQYTHSDRLFVAAANATSEEGMTAAQIEGVVGKVAQGEQGWTKSWVAAAVGGGTKRIKHIVLRHGGHNRVTTYPVVSKAVMDLFGL